MSIADTLCVGTRIAFALTRPRVSRRHSPQRRVALLWIGGVSYAALTVLTIWQAQRGQSLVAPDGVTLAVLATWLLATALAVVLTVAWPKAANLHRVTIQPSNLAGHELHEF